jgi:hypothetical protein
VRILRRLEFDCKGPQIAPNVPQCSPMLSCPDVIVGNYDGNQYREEGDAPFEASFRKDGRSSHGQEDGYFSSKLIQTVRWELSLSLLRCSLESGCHSCRRRPPTRTGRTTSRLMRLLPLIFLQLPSDQEDLAEACARRK